MTLLRSLKKNSFIAIAALGLVAFTACNDDKKEKTNAVEATETTEAAENTKTTETKKDGEVALNPAHGEPGHRCDIPVGAPLDSPSRTQIQSQSQSKTSPVIKKSGNTNNNSSTSDAKKNPPHGQPGHRCDIPVGADLDS